MTIFDSGSFPQRGICRTEMFSASVQLSRLPGGVLDGYGPMARQFSGTYGLDMTAARR
jgi:hypothetical protein